MDKIAIVTDKPEPEHGLLASLNRLFPDREVRIVSREAETLEQGPEGCSSGPFTTYTTERARWQTFWYRSKLLAR